MKLHLGFTAAALVSTAALAQAPGGAAPSSPFDALDADGNGSLSAQEAQAHPVVSQNFAAADRNGDGSLTREEFDSAFTTTQPTEPQAPPAMPSPPQ